MKYETCTRHYWEYGKEIPDSEQVGSEATRPVWRVQLRLAVQPARRTVASVLIIWGSPGVDRSWFVILASSYQA